ncbi:MAG: fructosamine kinase family protein [Gammaproteobacteria bacterium]|nr:fructosamine kinase family protein [Gammaproteobacteria bacterium]MBT8109553.1 fructosamine kinase family protein [Gammaproteobacteria bacterium]NND46146.1 fructosamine kinase family protein [Woeseiaceae bacterium]NNL44255.1 fructosamine kinase family protein [Woeseiaceae bacterium]
MPDWGALNQHLRDAGIPLAHTVTPRPVGGGDISAAWRLDTDDGGVFLKTGPVPTSDMFAAEADGLAEIAKADALRVPEVLAVGQIADAAFLALEWLPLDRADARCEQRLGEQLAKMHRTTSDRFGWHRDNTIGLTPQHNCWNADWVEFFREHRIAYQLNLAAQNGYNGELQRQGLRLLERLPSLFDDYRPLPSLLHGDLWGGNWASSGGQPVIFDPAVYYGDRETDLAMTRLFGGFGRAFYDAYDAAWPLGPGSTRRQDLYQLYHVLNHLNLFGSGYQGRALALIRGLL